MSQQTAFSATSISEGTDLPTKATSTSTFTFDTSGAEEPIPVFTLTALNDDIDASLDMSALTGGNEPITVKLVETVSDTEEQIKEWEWPTDNDSVNDEVLKISIIGHGRDVRVLVTPTSTNADEIDIAIATYSY